MKNAKDTQTETNRNGVKTKLKGLEHYEIERPPIHFKTFERPDKETIENLKKGDTAKVILVDRNAALSFMGKKWDYDIFPRERIWTEIVSIDEAGWVVAKLANSPLCQGLRYKQRIKYHVTDIISTFEVKE
jgi:hypothetical protein